MIKKILGVFFSEPDPDFPCQAALLTCCNRPAVLIIDVGRELASLGGKRFLTACEYHNPFKTMPDWASYLKSTGWRIISRDEAIVQLTMQE